LASLGGRSTAEKLEAPGMVWEAAAVDLMIALALPPDARARHVAAPKMSVVAALEAPRQGRAGGHSQPSQRIFK
jgi:hypothetical protein